MTMRSVSRNWAHNNIAALAAAVEDTEVADTDIEQGNIAEEVGDNIDAIEADVDILEHVVDGKDEAVVCLCDHFFCLKLILIVL